MTEKTSPRVALIVGGAIIAIAAISLLVYFLAQPPADDPGTASDPTTTETPQATDEPGDDDATDTADADDDPGDGSDESTNGGSDEPGHVDGKKTYLDKEMSGQEAIDALGDDIDEVAERNNRSVKELEKLLLNNPSAHVTPDGFIVFHDTFSNDD